MRRKHPPSPLTLHEGGRFLAPLGMTWVGAKGEMGRPLRLRKGTRTSGAMFAGDASGWTGGMAGRQENIPLAPLRYTKGGDSSLRSE